MKECVNNNGELKNEYTNNNGHQTSKLPISKRIDGCERTVWNNEIAHRVKCNDVVLGFNPRKECAKFGMGNESCNNCNAAMRSSQDSAVRTAESTENGKRIGEQTGARDCGQIDGQLGQGQQNGNSTPRRNDPRQNTTRMDVIEEEGSEKEMIEKMVEGSPLELEEKKEQVEEEEEERQMKENESEAEDVLSGRNDLKERINGSSVVELSDNDGIDSENTLKEDAVESVVTNVDSTTEDDNAYLAEDSLSNSDSNETVDEADLCDARIDSNAGVSNYAVDVPEFCETRTLRQDLNLWNDDRQDSDSNFSDDDQNDSKFGIDYQHDPNLRNHNETLNREGNCSRGSATINCDHVRSNYNNSGFDNVQTYEETSGVTFSPTPFSVTPGNESHSFPRGDARQTDILQSLREETSNSVAATTANAASRPRRGCNVPNFFKDPREKSRAASSSSSPSPLLPSSSSSSPSSSPTSRLSQERQEADAESRVSQKGVQMKNQRKAARPEATRGMAG